MLMLGTVTNLKYLGAIVSDDGPKPEILSRIAQATVALTKLKPMWRGNNVSLGSKVKLICTLVIDRGRGEKTISKGGQELTLPAQVGRLKTGQDGKGLLRTHLWCPDDLPRL